MLLVEEPHGIASRCGGGGEPAADSKLLVQHRVQRDGDFATEDADLYVPAAPPDGSKPGANGRCGSGTLDDYVKALIPECLGGDGDSETFSNLEPARISGSPASVTLPP